MAEGRIRLTADDATGGVVSSVGKSIGTLTAETLQAQKAVADLNKELQEAVAKGQQGSIAAISAQLDEAIPRLQQAEQALKSGLKPAFEENTTAVSGWSSVMSSATSVLGAFGIGLGAAQLVRFGEQVLDDVGHLNDLSAATGVSTTDLQAFQYVGANVGLSLDDMSRAVGNLSTRLAKGDGNAVSAVQSLGLNIKQLLAEGPTQAFEDIGAAVSGVADPMQRDALAAELFGDKVGRKLLPALGDLKTQLDQVPKEAILSDEEVKAIDAVGDAWDRAKLKVEGYAAKAIAAMLAGNEAAHAAERRAAAEMGAEGGDIGQVFWVQAGKDISLAASQGATAADLLANRLKALRSEALEPLTAAQKANIAELKSYGESESTIAKLVDASQGAVHRYVEELRTGAEETKKHTAETERLTKALNDKINAIAGSSKGDELAFEAMRRIIDSGPQETDVVHRMVDELDTMHKAHVAIPPDLEAWRLANESLGTSYETLEQKVKHLELTVREGIDLGKTGSIAGDITQMRASIALDAKLDAESLSSMKAAVTAAGHQAETVFAGAFSAIEQDVPDILMRAFEGGGGVEGAVKSLGVRIGKSLGDELAHSKIGEGLSDKLGDLFHVKTAEGAGLIANSVSGMFSAGISTAINFGVSLIGKGINALLHIGGPSKEELAGRDLVSQIEEAHGGWQGLQRDLLAAGLNADEANAKIKAMWDAEKLGAKATQKAIDDVNQALERQKQLAQDAQDATSGLGDFFGANASATDSLSSLQQQMDDINNQRNQLVHGRRNDQMSADELKQVNDLDKKWDDLKQKANEARGVIAATAITSQDAATAMGAAVVGAFDLAIQGGETFTQALKQNAPAIENLQKELAAAGFDGGEAFNLLAREAALMKDPIAGPALTAVQSLASGFKGLSASGKETQTEFQGFGSQVKQTLDSLTAQGKSSEDITIALQDPLQELWQEEQKYGFTLDDATQSLLDQAVATGEVGETHKSTSEQMLDAENKLVDVMSAMATAMGVTLPDSVTKGVDIARGKIGGLKSDIVNLPSSKDFTFTTHYETDGAPPPEAPPDVPSAANEAYDLGRPMLARIGDAAGDTESVLHGSTVKQIVNAAKNAGAAITSSDVAAVVSQAMATLNGTMQQVLAVLQDKLGQPPVVNVGIGRGDVLAAATRALEDGGDAFRQHLEALGVA